MILRLRMTISAGGLSYQRSDFDGTWPLESIRKGRLAEVTENATARSYTPRYKITLVNAALAHTYTLQ